MPVSGHHQLRERRPPQEPPTIAPAAFNAQAFLDSSEVAKGVIEYARDAIIFTQGDLCEDVLYIQTGGVKLSVLLKTGREAVVAMLGLDDFFGEGCLAGQPVRMGSATAITPSVIRLVKARMVRLLLQHPGHQTQGLMLCAKASFVEPMLLLRTDTLPDDPARWDQLKFDGSVAITRRLISIFDGTWPLEHSPLEPRDTSGQRAYFRFISRGDRSPLLHVDLGPVERFDPLPLEPAARSTQDRNGWNGRSRRIRRPQVSR